MGTPDFTRLPKSCGLTKINDLFSSLHRPDAGLRKSALFKYQTSEVHEKDGKVENREKGAINPRDFGGHGILDFRSLVNWRE
jgi:hypothetical protein